MALSPTFWPPTVLRSSNARPTSFSPLEAINNSGHLPRVTQLTASNLLASGITRFLVFLSRIMLQWWSNLLAVCLTPLKLTGCLLTCEVRRGE